MIIQEIVVNGWYPIHEAARSGETEEDLGLSNESVYRLVVAFKLVDM
jgi:hypothetical protein